MSSYEVEQPILNPPYDEPAEHWYIDEGTPPERRSGRRPAGYFYRDPTAPPTEGEHEARGQWVELALVNLIRERLNVTIRNWLQELDPANGEASLYRTRDLVPPHLMPDLIRGRVLVTNWHVFEPQGIQVGGLSAKVSKAGVPVRVKETITIGAKTPTARGRRYLTPAELDWQVAAGLLTVLSEERDSQGHLKKVFVESVKYVESDIALVNRILGREVGGKQNILVFNADIRDVFLSPSYGWVIERLVGAITGEVDFWTSREVREVIHSHLNYVVADTRQWEQSAASARGPQRLYLPHLLVDEIDDLLDRLPGGWRSRIPRNEPRCLALKQLQLYLATRLAVLRDKTVEVGAGMRDVAGALRVEHRGQSNTGSL